MNPVTKNNLSDKALVNKVLSGDAHAFRALVSDTERLVAQIVYKMTGHPEDRKDLVQDIYLKVFKNLPEFRFRAKLSTWIAQIAYNTCLTHLDKRKLVLGGDGELIGLEDSRGESRIFEKERSEILKAEIEKLSPVYKTLIALYHMEELSYAEIGEIMALPEGTVKSYLFRARKALRESLLLQYKKEEL